MKPSERIAKVIIEEMTLGVQATHVSWAIRSLQDSVGAIIARETGCDSPKECKRCNRNDEIIEFLVRLMPEIRREFPKDGRLGDRIRELDRALTAFLAANPALEGRSDG